MLRTRVPTISRSLLARRSFAYTPRIMAEGDTGAPRATGDAFTKREKAAEEMYIRQEEQAKLKALREKIKNAQKHMDELDSYIQETMKGQGGEQH
ncbi:uncharacterized protein PV09_00569 [Verruconis gallopava]|uniref:ATPase inhibitor, mitochondrial n=1 Tax=Verruconis gallopava TaxID=253628 RepID=A0A0D2AQ36_9PEZI|nr:uncharacterized protein PV09_00569 [Verruconis gallopava]KIW08610.1 hypothetical protein PV09_00569 [Verruconis gallopava]